MSAIHHFSDTAFLGFAPEFSFYEVAEIHEEAPSPYMAAMQEIKIRERLLGDGWFKHNVELAHTFYEMKRFWWL